jgi:imidazolonepropionase-like amidohydrolase
MPTMSLSYLDLPEAKNPWLDPVASILDSEDINRPADPQTGKHDIDEKEQKAYTDLITNETSVIEPTYYKAGAKYLSGSATDVWGTMPGISLHTELMLLHTKAGLTIEETLAATTSNFSEAFGWKVGKIKAGFEADLLLLNANPLDKLSNLTTIDKLFVDGKELIPETLLKQTNDH